MNFEEIRNKWKDLNRNKLPDVTASDNGKIAKVASGEWATGDDNDEKHLLVTITGADETYSSDKSLTAIKSAITAKQEIDCRLQTASGEYTWLTLMSSTSTTIVFYTVFLDGTTPKLKTATITSSGVAIADTAFTTPK